MNGVRTGCQCSHRKMQHSGPGRACLAPGCGCTRYRAPALPAVPAAPRVITGTAERSVPAVTP